jgi:hypothetical protein
MTINVEFGWFKTERTWYVRVIEPKPKLAGMVVGVTGLDRPSIWWHIVVRYRIFQCRLWEKKKDRSSSVGDDDRVNGITEES